MCKKLSPVNFFLFFFMSVTITIISICYTTLTTGFFDFISVFDMNNFMVENTILFSVVEQNTINTEIVARRVGSGLATAGLGGVGTGIGLVFSGLIKGFSRNPSLKDDLFSYAIFGFALTEAIGLFALMMAFMLLYA